MMDKLDQDILLNPFGEVLKMVENLLFELPKWSDRKEREGAEIALGRVIQCLLDKIESLTLATGHKNLIEMRRHCIAGLDRAEQVVNSEEELSGVIKALRETLEFVVAQTLIVSAGLHGMNFRTDDQIRAQLEGYRESIKNGAHKKRFEVMNGLVN